MVVDPSRLDREQFAAFLERQGLVESWRWDFATGEQAWSRGMYGLLGLEVGPVRPCYDVLRSLMHPDDRCLMPDGGTVRQGLIPAEERFRIVRPRGATRTLATRNEIFFAPDGRPMAAAGLVLDVTAAARLNQVRLRDRQRFEALARDHFIVNYQSPGHDSGIVHFDYPAAFQPSLGEMRDDPYSIIAVRDRARAREVRESARALGRIAQGTFRFRKADGSDVACRAVEVPIFDEFRRILEWSGIIAPLSASISSSAGFCRTINEAVRGHHLRAARAMLDCSMVQFSEISGLSVSSLRRLEEDAACSTARVRQRAIAAFHAVGIDFICADDGSIAVAKT